MDAGSSWQGTGQRGGWKGCIAAPRTAQHVLLCILIDRTRKRAVEDTGCPVQATKSQALSSCALRCRHSHRDVPASLLRSLQKAPSYYFSPPQDPYLVPSLPFAVRQAV